MKNIKGVEKYSTEYDDIMDTPLKVVKGVYAKTTGCDYSIKIPNYLTSMKEVPVMGGSDGYHPTYTRDLETYLAWHGLKSDNELADYPRHDNTLRLFYKSLSKASDVVLYIGSYVRRIGTDLEYLNKEKVE